MELMHLLFPALLLICILKSSNSETPKVCVPDPVEQPTVIEALVKEHLDPNGIWCMVCGDENRPRPEDVWNPNPSSDNSAEINFGTEEEKHLFNLEEYAALYAKPCVANTENPNIFGGGEMFHCGGLRRNRKNPNSRIYCYESFTAPGAVNETRKQVHHKGCREYLEEDKKAKIVCPVKPDFKQEKAECDCFSDACNDSLITQILNDCHDTSVIHIPSRNSSPGPDPTVPTDENDKSKAEGNSRLSLLYATGILILNYWIIF